MNETTTDTPTTTAPTATPTAGNGTALARRPALAPPTTIGNPDANELATLTALGKVLHASGFCKGARTPEQAVAIVLMGREIGVPAMQALSTIHVIEGKPTAGVHLIGAMLARGGVTWSVDASDEHCQITFARPGWSGHVSRFNRADAFRAGLWGKNTWAKYPRAMLYARAFTEGARIIAPDLLCGILYTPEELGAEVNGDGEPRAALAPAAPRRTETVVLDRDGRVTGRTVAEDEPPAPAPAPDAQAAPKADARPITAAQGKRAFALAQETRTTLGVKVEAKQIMIAALAAIGVEHAPGHTLSAEVTRDRYDALCDAIRAWTPLRCSYCGEAHDDPVHENADGVTVGRCPAAEEDSAREGDGEAQS